MDAQVRPHPQHPRISEEERTLRRQAVDFGRANVRLEGFILDDEAEAIYARYIEGDLDEDGLTAAILEKQVRAA
ncbi:MAG: hypothetical protein F8N15_09830 [Methanobacterium sp.]|nr:hypothetical protein [Methanobacterium sp.]